MRAAVKKNLRTAVKTKEDTVTATRKEKEVFHFHHPEEALKRINPLEIIEQ